MQMYHKLRVQHANFDRRILVALVHGWYVAQHKTHAAENDLVAYWIALHPQTSLPGDDSFGVNVLARFSPDELSVLGVQLYVAN